MSRNDEFSASSFAEAMPGQDHAARTERPRLSQQQKDWILETINRLKAPNVVPDEPREFD